MHIPTHILSGWCVGNLVPSFTPRERALCMIAATAADLDGLGLIYSVEAYWAYHHKLAHNVFFAAIIAGILAAFSSRKLLAFAVYLALAHLHLILDYLGSGPGWPIHYLWPISNREILNPRAWPFSSWQNYAGFVALLLWTLLIAVRYRRTPIEWLAPRLDRGFVSVLLRSLCLKDVPAMPINPS